MNGRENFPHLSALSIIKCPKLVELPIIPSIISFYSSRNNVMLISSVMDLTSLSSLQIEFMDELTILLDGLLQNHKMLESFKISNLPNLKPLTNQLNYLSALKQFHLSCCYELESLLEELQNLRSLQVLDIMCCENLLSFLMNGLRGLSSLRSLRIQSCKIFCSFSEGIQYLTTLQGLLIHRCSELISFPEGIQHLTALHSLQIMFCKGLSSLPKHIG